MSPEFVYHLLNMRHSPVHNYVVPGLTSWMIGQPDPVKGCIRMFESTRLHEEPISPHSHRFDFHCLVLQGCVMNNIWEIDQQDGDVYEISDVTYEGVFGQHKLKSLGFDYFSKKQSRYDAGQEYSMKARQIHSIFFSKGAKVLFFEGPPVTATSVVLEPVVDGIKIPLMRTGPWMFKRER